MNSDLLGLICGLALIGACIGAMEIAFRLTKRK